MPRYIDEKDVYVLVEPIGIARVHCSQIDELPRADVVPRAEVEKIFAEIDKLAYRYLNDADYSGGDMIYDLAELKNKYIGEKK